MPTLIGTATVQDATKFDKSGHILTMADGNEVVCYFDGTNGGYRIKSAGAWGAFTNLATQPAGGANMFVTRNGDNIYVLTGTDIVNTARLHKLAYAAGAITQTSVSDGFGDAVQTPLGIYYDATNGYVHCWFWLTSLANSVLRAWDVNLVSKITITATNLNPGSGGGANGALAGDGTSTFFTVLAAGTALSATKIVAAAAAYTQTNETGVPALAAAAATVTAVYDGTNLLILANENNAKIRLTTRTAVNTYAALVDLVTATLGAATEIATFRRGVAAGSDLALFFRGVATQANGEIFYLRRFGGVWDASPGTLLAGGAATGWSNVSSASSDLNVTAASIARVTYMTGTGSPWSLTEDSINLNRPPLAPVINLPLAATVYNGTVTLSATATDPDGDTWYAGFEWALNGGGWTVIGNGGTVASAAASTLAWNTDPLARGNTYQVRARGTDPTGGNLPGPYTTTGTFTIDYPPAAPTIVSPVGGAAYTTATITLSAVVTDVDAGDTGSATWELSTDDGGSWAPIAGGAGSIVGSGGTSTRQWDVSALPASIHYRVRAQVTDAFGVAGAKTAMGSSFAIGPSSSAVYAAPNTARYYATPNTSRFTATKA